jgi:hypothetical protein
MAEKPQRLAMRARIARLTTISPSSIRTRDRSLVVEPMRYDSAVQLPECGLKSGRESLEWVFSLLRDLF